MALANWADWALHRIPAAGADAFAAGSPLQLLQTREGVYVAAAAVAVATPVVRVALTRLVFDVSGREERRGLGGRRESEDKRKPTARETTGAAFPKPTSPPLPPHQPVGRAAIPALVKSPGAPLTQSQRYKLVKWNGEREKEGFVVCVLGAPFFCTHPPPPPQNPSGR